ncbi:phosphotransferase family protein [Saccharomonospora iraqiensis]|uniref:phosphotransferase family protein n=1 Tax=Saccharomonospora iraqiensis TaxID=52698 RepID=UPI00059285CB|nr:aminoglycoside 3'-phosphotransferase/choline kinase family protein [Saccharomonospora iraqiensis]
MDDPPLRTTLARLRLTGAAVHRFPDGSLPVYSVGDHLVLKFYPDDDRDEARTEAAVLRSLTGALSVPTPEMEETGTADGWHYVLMRRLRGRSLDGVWPTLSRPERERLTECLGAVLAELHAVDDPAVAELGPDDWATFLRRRRAAVVAAQGGLGLARHWLDQIPDYLDRVGLGTPAPVLLHTEFLPAHVLVRHDGRRWLPSGLLDFEPARTGAAEYDFVAVGTFLTRGDPVLLRRFLRGYGIGDHPGTGFARRCLAYTLLHRYANLPGYLAALPAPARPELTALADAWFG